MLKIQNKNCSLRKKTGHAKESHLYFGQKIEEYVFGLFMRTSHLVDYRIRKSTCEYRLWLLA
jgi:hypothetical protein